MKLLYQAIQMEKELGQHQLASFEEVTAMVKMMGKRLRREACKSSKQQARSLRQARNILDYQKEQDLLPHYTSALNHRRLRLAAQRTASYMEPIMQHCRIKASNSQFVRSLRGLMQVMKNKMEDYESLRNQEQIREYEGVVESFVLYNSIIKETPHKEQLYFTVEDIKKEVQEQVTNLQKQRAEFESANNSSQNITRIQNATMTDIKTGERTAVPIYVFAPRPDRPPCQPYQKEEDLVNL